MINLPEFEVVKKEVSEYYYRFTIKAIERPFMCTQCMWDEMPILGDDKKFIVHSTKEREVADVPIHGKPVKLILKHTRYKCPCCGKTFYQPFRDIERNCKVTLRLKEYIQQQSLIKPFSQVGYDTNLSPTSVKNYFQEQIDLLDSERTLVAPKVLGIDEAHLNKKMRGVFTDTENNKLLEITEDNLKRTVKETIKSMEGYENIEVVTIDMWSGYKYACKELIPQALIVIDKFHVIQYAQRALDSVRKSVKSTLDKDRRKVLTNDRWVLLKNKEDLTSKEIALRDAWFDEFPELGVAYGLKENLRDVYKCESRYDAFQKYYYEFESEIPPTNLFQPFKDIRNTFENNKAEIFNYFLRRETNAYTESINNIIKSVEKAGKGYSYEVLRAKVLYGTTATKRPKLTKEMKFRTFKYMTPFSGGYDKPNTYEFESFEVDINELQQHIGGKSNE